MASCALKKTDQIPNQESIKMKTLRKSLVAASLLAVGLAGTAFANTTAYVYVAGAPAYRQDSNQNLVNYVATFSGAGLTATSAPDTSAASVKSAKANQWFIPNFVAGTTDLVISATYTGSSAGIESVAAGNITQNYLPNSTGIAGNVGSTTNVGIAISQAHQPDFTLSDTFQTTSPFVGTRSDLEFQTPGNFPTLVFATLPFQSLGVEPYVFVASPGAPFTNITTSQAQLLFTNGKLPLAFFTGNSADETKFVYPLTRDPGSGARLVVQAETGIGVTTTLTTYKPTVTGGALDSKGNTVGGTITDPFNNIPLYPAGLIPSTQIIDQNDGDTGYPNFGTPDLTGLLQAITATPPAGSYFVTYLNLSDSSEASTLPPVGNRAVILTYNGVAENAANLADGTYTFWSYENLFNRSGVSGNPLTVINWLKTHWVSTAPLSSLKVQRTVDGGPVLKNY